MRILSIDIGIKNTAVYIESFDEKKLSFKNLYCEGKREYWELVDFTVKDDGGDVFVNITKYLDKNKKTWDKCNGIIIERQHKMNHTAQVIQHFITSYFRILYGSFKYISDISATRKTQALGAPKKMNKKLRKEWAISEAHKICDIRNDIEGLKILYATKKSDDLADSMIQLKAWQKLLFIEGKEP